MGQTAQKFDKPNRYPGTCTDCGGPVAAHAGLLGKDEAGKWVTRHQHDACGADAHEAPAVSTFEPTDEQEACLALFARGESMVIEAGAGTGKTATLKLLAESTTKRCQYVAFNKAIVAEAALKFPSHTACNTAHSLAFRAVGAEYKHRMDGPRQKSDVVAKMLRIDPIDIVVAKQERMLAAGFLAGLVLNAVTKFCQSADTEIARRHFAYIDGIDLPTEDGQRTFDNNDDIAALLLPFAKKAWVDLCTHEGQLRFSHDHYLKIWQLSGPRINAEVIFFDEAQDANPVLASIVEQQKDAQVIWVGDSQQCQPSGTMVTVVDSYRRGNRHTGVSPTTYRQVAIEAVRPGDQVVSFDLAHSFLRRTGSQVKRTAVRHYDGELITVEAGDQQTRYTPEHRCVVRFGDALVGKWIVYVMRRGTSYRVGMTKGVLDTQFGDMGLRGRMHTERADAAWILSTHDSENGARLAEMLTAWSYGVPSLRFQQGMARGVAQEDLDEFWSKMGDLTPAAITCLRAHGRDVNYPLATAGRRIYRNRSQVIEACNLVDGLLVLPMTGALDADGKQAARKHWQAINVGREFYSGPVYSLDVDRDETYVADGIVTHNCIYEFTGAVNTLGKLDSDHRVFLTQSFRFGEAIADVANTVLERLEAELRLVGTPTILSTVGLVERENAILCRTNASAVEAVLLLQDQGRRPHLVGGGTEVVKFAKGARNLMDSGHTDHPELACFSSWNQVLEYVDQDAQGSELRLLVKLVEKFTVPTILRALEQMPTERQADVIVSTAHKAKGREWDRVRLGGDFPTGDDDKEMGPSEMRLLYVAVTRARLHLDATSVQAFFAPPAPAPAPAVDDDRSTRWVDGLED